MEIIKQINWVDLLVVILIIRISYVAFQEGLSHEIFPAVGSLAIIVLCLHYYKRIGIWISQNIFNMPLDLSNFLSFLLLAVMIGVIFKILKAFLDKIIKVEWHPFIERFGGLAIGIMRASLVASLILMIIALMPLSYLQWSIRDKSMIGMHFLRIGPTIYEKCSRILPTIKVEGLSADREDLVKNLVSDKSIVPKIKKEKKERKQEWEE